MARKEEIRNATTEHDANANAPSQFTDVPSSDSPNQALQPSASAPVSPKSHSPPKSTDLPQTDPPPAVKPETIKVAETIMFTEVDLLHQPPSDLEAAFQCAPYSSKYLFSNGNMTKDRYREELAEQLNGLKWRFRIQEHIYLAMENLRDSGLINPARALNFPINWDSVPEPIWKIMHVLESFKICKTCSSTIDRKRLEGLFVAPVMWLAVIIVRTCSVIPRLVEQLRTSNLLGAFDQSHFDKLSPIEVRRDLHVAQAAQMRSETPQIGFWLPQDLGNMRKFVRAWHKKYYAAVKAYETCLGEGSWGDVAPIRQSLMPYLEECGLG